MFFLFFKHLLIKSILGLKYYKFFFKVYKLNVYNSKHKRPFFLFFLFIYKYKNYALYIELLGAYSRVEKIYLYNNNYTFFLLYLFNFEYDFFYHYDKVLFYDIYFARIFFFFEDFVIKADSRLFVYYRHYFEHFRRLKYNEYLMSNKALHDLPLLRQILHVHTGKLRRERIVDFRKNILFDELYNIVELEKGELTEVDFQYRIFYNKLVFKKLGSLPYLKFFKLFSESPYLIAIENFKPLIGTYLLLRAYHLYYLFNRRRLY